MLTGVQAQGGGRPRVPQHSRLPGSRPSPTSRLGARALPSRPEKPDPGSACPGKRLTARKLGCGERVQSKLCQRRLERSSQGPAGRAGARCAQKAACSPPPGPAPGPWPPTASPRSGRPPPGADRLPASSGQPGSPHTRTCAPPSARPAPKSAPSHTRAPSLARARRPGRSRDRRGSARCRRIVSRLPYISSRAQGSGIGGGPYGTSPTPAPPPPGRRQVGVVESLPLASWLLSPALFYSLCPPKRIAPRGAQGRRQADAAWQSPGRGVTLASSGPSPTGRTDSALFAHSELRNRATPRLVPRAYFPGLARLSSGASGPQGIRTSTAPPGGPQP